MTRVTPAAPLPVYSRSMRLVIYTLAILQIGLLALAVILTQQSILASTERGQMLGILTGAGILAAAFLTPAIAFAHSRLHQHYGMALALLPMAGFLGVSLYLN